MTELNLKKIREDTHTMLQIASVQLASSMENVQDNGLKMQEEKYDP